jgi:hypothetical protein
MKSGIDKAAVKATIISKISMAIHRGNGMCLCLSTISSAYLTRDMIFPLHIQTDKACMHVIKTRVIRDSSKCLAGNR